ncbi:MAG: flagellar motor protein MotB [Oligoflexia bacterium]|nr:flagellar motor protein MotB [Oligoflexia bacterium]
MAKKKHHEEHENHERWLVSYADFVTLLFATFTALFAMSQTDAAKAQEFQKSVQKAFRSYVDFGGLIGRFVDRRDADDIIPNPIDVVPREGAGAEEMKDFIKSQIEAMMSEEEIEQFLEFRVENAGVAVSLHASSFFDPGEALVREEALPVLNKVAEVLKKSNRVLIVEGHTDNEPIRNVRFPSNWELSSTRASTIVRYFQTIHRYLPQKLIAVGYADQRPLVANDTPQNRAKNRRIDILVVTNEKEALK